MSEEERLLRERFSDLFTWQRVQRRERIFVQAFFFAVLGSLVFFPFQKTLPYAVSPLILPLLFCPVMAGALFLIRPWGTRESLRALFDLDQSLGLEERALTAWDILGRKEKRVPELVVLAEAAQRLQGVDFRLLFKRRLPWHALWLPPLLLLWLLFVWFDVGVDIQSASSQNPSATLAQQLKEFSQGLKRQARSQGLAESLKVAGVIEDLAEKRLRGQMSENKLREELSGLASRIDEMPSDLREPAFSFTSTTGEKLSDLKTELEALKQALFLPETGQGEKRTQGALRGRLESLPRLSEELSKRRLPPDQLSQEELDGILGKLEKGVEAELDRRTLKEIGDFLRFLIRGDGEPGEEAGDRVAQGGADRATHGDRLEGPGLLPGDRPGKKEPAAQAPPPFEPGMVAHLKGILGEGRIESFPWRGKPRAGMSVVPVEDVIVSYRRQVEEELASEKIPEELKETIKNYFLSLGMTGEKPE